MGIPLCWLQRTSARQATFALQQHVHGKSAKKGGGNTIMHYTAVAQLHRLLLVHSHCLRQQLHYHPRLRLQVPAFLLLCQL